MLAAERRQNITAMAQKDKRVLVAELSQIFNVTEETIRRDLEKLEKEGVLTRTYGGAITTGHTNEDLPFATRNATNSAIKKEIAEKALNYIEDGDTLMVDPSSTSVELLKRLQNRKNLTVITSSILILHELIDSGIHVLSTGGSLRGNSMSLVGTAAQDTVRKYNVDKVILSCKALSPEKGIMDSNEPECELKRTMIRQAKKVILLADHTKFDKTAFVQLMDFEDVDLLVTDQKPPGPWLDILHKNGVEVTF